MKQGRRREKEGKNEKREEVRKMEGEETGMKGKSRKKEGRKQPKRRDCPSVYSCIRETCPGNQHGMKMQHRFFFLALLKYITTTSNI